MGDHLYIFTLQFPYGHGESFLEAEIPYLKDQFTKITIVPRDAGGELRKLPDGVVVDDSFSHLIPTGLRMLGAILKSMFTHPGIIKEVIAKPHLLTRWKSVKLLLYYAVIKNVIRRWCKLELPKNGLFYTYWIESFTYGLCELKEKEGFKVLTRAHRYDLFEAPHSRPYLPFRGEIYSKVDQVHAVSEAGFNYLREKHGLGDNQLKLSRLGTEDPVFLSKPSAEGKLCIVSCSNVNTIKRLDQIILCIQYFAEQSDVSVSWVHFGAGELSGTIEAMAEKYLNGLVDFHFTGSVANQAIFDHYKNEPVDLLINLSSIEGIPVSFMEAMSCGIPVVGTNVGGVAEILTNKNGTLLGANPSLDEISEALQTHTNHAPEYRLAARKTWEDKFNANINYNHFVASLEMLIDSRG